MFIYSSFMLVSFSDYTKNVGSFQIVIFYGNMTTEIYLGPVQCSGMVLKLTCSCVA